MKENDSPIAALPQETSSVGEEVKGSSGSPPTRKSLIPVRTPPKGVTKTERKPLTPIQGHKVKMISRQSSTAVASSSPVKKLPAPPATIKTNALQTSPSAKTSSLAQRPSSSLPAKKTAPSFSSTPISSPLTTKSNQQGVVINKTALMDKEVQTDHPDLALITGDEPPPSYWKDLAETRRQALEEALTENEELHKKVEELQKDNEILEEMLEQAKQMAEMVSSFIPEDSGIAADESIRSTDNSELETAEDEEDRND